MRIRAALVLLLVLVTAMSVSLPSSASETKSLCSKSDHLTVQLPDPVSRRRYEIYVSLPADYSESSGKTYPLVIIADGGRAFPTLSCDARALANSNAIDQAVIVGLSYALGENLEDSRRRDYTPVALPSSGKLYGGAAAYQRYLGDVVLPYLQDHYRVASNRRIFWGHSYGGLLGARILLTEPSLFQTYLLGSPSFWFADEAIFDLEAGYAEGHHQLNAEALLYVGSLETGGYDSAHREKSRDMVAGMHKFEERLRSRGYSGLRISSTVIPGKDHIGSARPGFAWAIKKALGN